MITHTRRRTNTCHQALAATLTALLLATACSDDENPVNPDDRLCGGETGVGLLIEGRAEPFEFCIDDPDVSVVLTSQNRYDVAAQVSSPDGVFVVRMVFAVRSFPATLSITENLSDTNGDPGVVWLYYEEIPAGGDPIESYAIDGGSFTLSFVDEDVAVGYMSNVRFQMRDFTTGDPAGQRTFAEGIFSISTKEPTVTTKEPTATTKEPTATTKVPTAAPPITATVR